MEHESFVLLTKAFNGGMVNSAETALAIASAILSGHYGSDELSKQRPLKVVDEGDSWFVKGAYRDHALDPEDGGSWHIRILKDDARVVAMGHSIADLGLSSEMKAAIAKAKS
jgi:NTF2 fold immunity protein